MNYTYSSITRVLSIQHKGRVKTYSDINLFGIEACIKDDTKTVVAIERMVEQQVEASGMDSRRLERLDGWKIIEAAVKAQEQKV